MSTKGFISIIVISYNRSADLLDLLKNISGLQQTELLNDVVIVNNQSTEDYSNVEAFINSRQDIPFKYIVAEKNLGVSAGRNFAIEQTSAPVLVFVDDDALFEGQDALKQVASIFEQAPSTDDRPLGIAAFKVLYYQNRQMQVNAFPHKAFGQKKHLHEFETYYYSGCAHAIRNEVFQKVGPYPSIFFYGMEEYDLSYRTIEAGFKIEYHDSVTVLHKESPGGRLTPSDKLRGMWVNKSIVAYRYLPKKYFYSTAFLWSLEYLQKTGGDVRGWWKGWQQVMNIKHQHRREPLKDEAMSYLQKVDARLNY